MKTRAPGHDVLLYDGDCALCRGAARHLAGRTREGGVEARSFRSPHALAPFPGLGWERCDRAIHLVRGDGEVYAGVEAAVEVLRHRPFGRLARALLLPGIRPTAEGIYRLLARVRHRI